jgi:hypothetical protein
MKLKAKKKKTLTKELRKKNKDQNERHNILEIVIE